MENLFCIGFFPGEIRINEEPETPRNPRKPRTRDAVTQLQSCSPAAKQKYSGFRMFLFVFFCYFQDLKSPKKRENIIETPEKRQSVNSRCWSCSLKAFGSVYTTTFAVRRQQSFSLEGLSAAVSALGH